MAELAPRPDAPAVMRKLPDGRTGMPAPVLRLGPGAEARSLGLRPEGGASVALQLRPDGVAAREPELRPDGVAAAGVEPIPSEAAVLPASPRARPAVVEPLAPARYKVQFTASAGLHDKLERLRALMRSSVPDGDLAAIVEQAVTEKLQRLEARRFARTQAPRKTLSQSETSPTTRQIPAAVKRAVYERDGGRCRYEDEQGRRCTARQGLEFHHRRPFGHGGDHSVDNIALACKCHNGYLAEVDYGREAMARHRRSGTRPLEPAVSVTLTTPIEGVPDPPRIRWPTARRLEQRPRPMSTARRADAADPMATAKPRPMATGSGGSARAPAAGGRADGSHRADRWPGPRRIRRATARAPARGHRPTATARPQQRHSADGHRQATADGHG